jgi:hypothetical protein
MYLVKSPSALLRDSPDLSFADRHNSRVPAVVVVVIVQGCIMHHRLPTLRIASSLAMLHLPLSRAFALSKDRAMVCPSSVLCEVWVGICAWRVRRDVPYDLVCGFVELDFDRRPTEPRQ